MLEMFEDKSTLGISIGVLVVLITFVILWLLRSKKSTRKNILLIGASNSGKTRLFCELVYQKDALTQISIVPNRGDAVIKDGGKTKTVSLVDIPGQDKVRRKYFSLYKRSAKAIAFVIDSLSFQKECKDVAQFMYEVLTDETLSKTKLNFLIVCHKQDIDLSKGQSFIKANLEKEIELLRKISTSALTSTSGSSGEAKSNLLVKSNDSNKQFEFSHLKYTNVEFCETSCQNFDPLRNWLLSN
ncbi:unnamed protein product [Brachionus calyciflorus]|uniref:ADP-ribosylation factor-related protein 1 n=1 Tax=Brachionus calyciflorus TaxID=104777 RepID=A0A813N169_9BILA|nr:unnamed protein product [Brachionus calyciflorus]